MRLIHRSTIFFLVGALASTLTSPWCEAADEPQDPRKKKVLILTIDGCRPDSLLAARTPNIDKLWRQGAFSFLAVTDQFSVSGPSFTSMLTGVWHDKHNVLSNDYKKPNTEKYPHFFRRIKMHRPDLFTASVVWWQELHLILQPGDADHLVVNMDDNVVAKAAVDTLVEKDPSVLFVHFNDADAAGHKHGYGPQITDYLAAIEACDHHIGTILQALHGRKTYEQDDWLVMVTTDHGGLKTKTHGGDTPQELTVFIIAHGPSVAAGEIDGRPGVVDVAATALTHLGIAIDEKWDFDGRAVGLKEDTFSPTPTMRFEATVGDPPSWNLLDHDLGGATSLAGSGWTHFIHPFEETLSATTTTVSFGTDGGKEDRATLKSPPFSTAPGGWTYEIRVRYGEGDRNQTNEAHGWELRTGVNEGAVPGFALVGTATGIHRRAQTGALDGPCVEPGGCFDFADQFPDLDLTKFNVYRVAVLNGVASLYISEDGFNDTPRFSWPTRRGGVGDDIKFYMDSTDGRLDEVEIDYVRAADGAFTPRKPDPATGLDENESPSPDQ